MKLTLEEGNPHLTLGKLIVPLKQHLGDQGMCSLDVTLPAPSDVIDNTTNAKGFNDEETTVGKAADASYDNMPGAIFAAAVSADVWHRRLGHLNPWSMELLCKRDGNGVEYTGGVSDCDICVCPQQEQTTCTPQDQFDHNDGADGSRMHRPDGPL